MFYNDYGKISMIICILIVYIVCLIMVLIMRKNKDKQYFILKDYIMKKIESINNLLYDIDNEENYHQRLLKAGRIFYWYKEILLLIDNSINERRIKNLIYNDLKNFYNDYFFNYINKYNNKERFAIIEEFLSRWEAK